MANTSRTNPGEAPVIENTTEGVDTLRNIQTSFEKNQKAIIGVIVAVVVLVGGYFGYKNFVEAPKEEKAASALFSAERSHGAIPTRFRVTAVLHEHWFDLGLCCERLQLQ